MSLNDPDWVPLDAIEEDFGLSSDSEWEDEWEYTKKRRNAKTKRQKKALKKRKRIIPRNEKGLANKKKAYKKKARERSTILHYLRYARIFKEANNIDEWFPTPHESLYPPSPSWINNDALENFFVHVWEAGFSKPAVVQGRKYINHVLTTFGKPKMNDARRDLYGTVLDLIKGMQKEEEWRDHVSRGAGAMTLDQVKAIMNVKVKHEDGSIDMLKLRNKAIAVLMILNHRW